MWWKDSYTCTPFNILNTCVEITEKDLFCLQMRIINTSFVFWRLTLFAAWFKFVVVKKKVAFTPFSNLNTCDKFPEKKGFYFWLQMRIIKTSVIFDLLLFINENNSNNAANYQNYDLVVLWWKDSYTCTPFNILNTCVDITEKKLFFVYKWKL